jgi:hypothetical protein
MKKIKHIMNSLRKRIHIVFVKNIDLDLNLDIKSLTNYPAGSDTLCSISHLLHFIYPQQAFHFYFP